jgi:ABC-type bacteriocin/lantibiotic exporter with double-glycine peptidase domain
MTVRFAAACLALAAVGAGTARLRREDAIRLPVPVIAQTPEHCGPAALEMVMRFHGAPDSVAAEAEYAYSTALRGALITDLARVARHAGFEALVTTLTEDSLLVLLRDSIPPILHYRVGSAPLTRGHFGVLAGWDPARREYLVNDGGAHTARFRRDDLMKRWRAADSLALVVRRPSR